MCVHVDVVVVECDNIDNDDEDDDKDAAAHNKIKLHCALNYV